MENPNAGGANVLRRHNSLPAFRLRSRSRNLAAKSNPYVGWFRYSPPISSVAKKKSHRFLYNRRKSSPYVGWFRHAPPSQAKFTSVSSSSSSTMLVNYLENELPHMLRSVPARDADGLLLNLQEILSTHLVGGAPDTYWNKKKHHDHNALSSGTSSLLSKVSCWILESFQDDHDNEFMMHYTNNKVWEASLEASNSDESSGSEEDDDESSTSSADSHDDSYSHSSLISDDSSFDRRRRRSSSISSSSSSMMVSSQAEAHYAHSLLTSRTRPGLSSSGVYDSRSENDMNAASSGFLGRLDYDITQMDIVRMTRNASRHLDVESILKLPTITYHSSQSSSVAHKDESNTDTTRTEESSARKEEWSWMFVQGGNAHEVSTATPTNKVATVARQEHPLPKGNSEEKDICVICLEHFVEGDRLRVLPCDHSFHVSCVDHWLSGSHSFEECYTAGCPTCKQRPDRPLCESSESAVPSWAFARVGNALARRDSSRELA